MSSKKRHTTHSSSKESKQAAVAIPAESELQVGDLAEDAEPVGDPVSSIPDPMFSEPEELVVLEAVDQIVDAVLEHVHNRSIDERVVPYAVSWVRKEMEDILASVFVRRDEGETGSDEAAAKAPWRPDVDMDTIAPDAWSRGSVPVRRRAAPAHRRTGGLGLPGEKAPSVVMSQRSLSRSRQSNYQRRATQHAASIAAAMKGNTGEVARGEVVQTEEAAQAKKEDDANATAERRAARKQAEARKRAVEDRTRRERRAKEEHERSVRLMRELASSDYTLDHNGNVVFVSRVEPDKLPGTRVHVGARVMTDGVKDEKEGDGVEDKKTRRRRQEDKQKKEMAAKRAKERKEKREKQVKLSVSTSQATPREERVPVVRVVKKKEDKEDKPRDYLPAASAGSLVSSMKVAAGVAVYDEGRRAGTTTVDSPVKRRDEGGRVHITKQEYDSFMETQANVFQSGRDLTQAEYEQATSLSATLNLRADGVSAAVRNARLPPPAFAPVKKTNLSLPIPQ